MKPPKRVVALLINFVGNGWDEGMEDSLGREVIGTNRRSNQSSTLPTLVLCRYHVDFTKVSFETSTRAKYRPVEKGNRSDPLAAGTRVILDNPIAYGMQLQMQSKWGGTKWGPRQRVSLSPFCLAFTQIWIASATAYRMPLTHVESDALVFAPSAVQRSAGEPSEGVLEQE
ncbi:hypothetical protein B0H13DRAFT_1875400 [Mycena leptocephala]|nr:hypothetical protein B0H13DRAFT_1875400 [Mycena leptocephala]